MRPEMKYGLIAGLGMSLWMLAEFLLGLHTTHLDLNTYTNWGTEVILFVILYLFLRQKMSVLQRYWLPVWEGFLYGALTSLVAGLLFCTFLNIYLRFINPDWPFHYLNWHVAKMRTAGQSEDSIRLFAGSFRWSVTPVGLAVNSIGLYTLLGALVSPVLTMWLNWRRKEPFEQR